MQHSRVNLPFNESNELDNLPGVRPFPENPVGFLLRELTCHDLEELQRYLDWVAGRGYWRIDPLHEHNLKGRQVKVAEDADLHLIWQGDGVFLKPIPKCLYSHRFWQDNLSNNRSPIYMKTLGFLRSYAYLIRHESDFEIAKDAHLVPVTLNYTSFKSFIDHFRSVVDEEVSPRWHFGQLRLSRLDWAVLLFQPGSRRNQGILRKLYYRERYWETRQFLQGNSALLLFWFAFLSLLFSALQVFLAAEAMTTRTSGVKSSSNFALFFFWFNLFGLIVLVLISFIVVSAQLAFSGYSNHARQAQHRQRETRENQAVE